MDRETLARGCAALRLFPLPGTVLMPGARLPLHVFEPRYRELVADVLAGDGLLCVPQIIEGNEQQQLGSPALYPYAGVGRIVEHERLEDGRYNVVVEPLGRVRLVEELDTPHRYRVFSAELLPELGGEREALAATGQRLLALIAPRLAALGARGGNLQRALSQLPLDRVPEAVAPLCVVDGLARQAYLAENGALARAAQVELAVLTAMAEARAGTAGEA